MQELNIKNNDRFSLDPKNMEEALKFAQLMSESDLVPKNFKGKPGDVLIAVAMGREVGMAAMAAIQSIAVINGKPSIYGDSGKAILLAGGCIIEEDDTEVIKKTGIARCRITRPNRPFVERTFSLENAKTAKLVGKEGPWRTYPERQMAWRAFWFAARDAAADLLNGLSGAEERSDIVVINDQDIFEQKDIQMPKSLSSEPQTEIKQKAPMEKKLAYGLKKISTSQKNMLEALIGKSALTREDVKAQLKIEHLTDILMSEMPGVLKMISGNTQREPGEEG